MNDSGHARPDLTEAGVSVWLLAVGLASLAALLIPGGRALLPPCIFYETTHLYCPGCGATRAATALLHGDLSVALKANPLAVLLGPLLAYVLVRDAFELVGFTRLPRLPLTRAMVWGIVVLLVAYWVLRNVPVMPFSWLAPG